MDVFAHMWIILHLLNICFFIHWFIHVHVIYLLICLFIFSMHVFDDLFIHLLICLFNHWFIHLSVDENQWFTICVFIFIPSINNLTIRYSFFTHSLIYSFIFHSFSCSQAIHSFISNIAHSIINFNLYKISFFHLFILFIFVKNS